MPRNVVQDDLVRPGADWTGTRTAKPAATWKPEPGNRAGSDRALQLPADLTTPRDSSEISGLRISECLAFAAVSIPYFPSKSS